MSHRSRARSAALATGIAPETTRNLAQSLKTESRGSAGAGADQAALLEHDLEVVGVGGGHHRPAQLDLPLLVELDQRLVEGEHAVVLALGDDLVDVAGTGRVHDALLDAA